MKLNEWAETKGYSDRKIADLMTSFLQGAYPDEGEVSVPAVQKYRTGRVPKGKRIAAIYSVTDGWVTANDFYDLPVASDE